MFTKYSIKFDFILPLKVKSTVAKKQLNFITNE